MALRNGRTIAMSRVVALTSAVLLMLVPVAMAAALGIHAGKVVAAGDGKIAITDENDGDNEEFEVAPDAEITLDGKEVTLEELQPGHPVRIATKIIKGKQAAVVIEGRSRA